MTQQGKNTGGYSARQSAREREKRLQILRGIVIAVLAMAVLAGAITGVVSALRRGQGASPDTTSTHAPDGNPPEDGETPSPTDYDRAEALALLDAAYEEALNREITLSFGEDSWQFKIGDMASRPEATQEPEGGEDENPVDMTVRLTCDRAALDALAQSVKAAIDRDPVDATMQIVEVEKFTYTDSLQGYRLDAAALADELAARVERGEGGEIALQPEVIEPQVTRAALEGSTLLLGECYTTLEGSSSSRVNNVNLALSYFNFKTIDAGKRVSFNRVVGKRTEENGFSQAPEYAGTMVQTGIGGGTCQASTTIYGAVIRAGLEVVERYPHTMTVGYVPGSQDAAVNDRDKDLRFRNNTESTIYIFAYVDTDKNRAVCKIFGKPINPSVYIGIESNVLQADIAGRSVTYIDDTDGKQVWFKDDPPVLYKKGKAGLKSEAYRVYYDAATGAEVRREKLSSDYYMPEDDVYLRGVHDH